MRLVTDSTPIEKGTYSIMGETVAACSPCCGNTSVYGKGEKTACRVCEKEFAVGGAAVEIPAKAQETAVAKRKNREVESPA